jgi:Domain of unknown function (DUF4157)
VHTFAQQPKAAQQTTSTLPGRVYFGQSREASRIPHVQHTVANQAAGQWQRASPGRSEADSVHAFNFARISLSAPSIQRKPTISSPGDPFECQADAVADRVMRMVERTSGSSAPEIQRMCAGCEEEETTRPIHDSSSAALQSIEGGEEEPPEMTEADVQLKAESGSQVAARSSAAVDRLAGTQSGGDPLASGMRHPLEAAFGRDFSRVRVHCDSEAAEFSRQLSALAFTRGSHNHCTGSPCHKRSRLATQEWQLNSKRVIGSGLHHLTPVDKT